MACDIHTRKDYLKKRAGGGGLGLGLGLELGLGLGLLLPIFVYPHTIQCACSVLYILCCFPFGLSCAWPPCFARLFVFCVFFTFCMSGMSGGDLRSSLPPRPVRASIEEGTLFVLDCYPIKDALKAFGFKWEAPLKAWAKPIPTYQMQSVLSDIRNLCAEISIPFHEETRDSGPSRAPATPSRQQTAAQQKCV